MNEESKSSPPVPTLDFQSPFPISTRIGLGCARKESLVCEIKEHPGDQSNPKEPEHLISLGLMLSDTKNIQNQHLGSSRAFTKGTPLAPPKSTSTEGHLRGSERNDIGVSGNGQVQFP